MRNAILMFLFAGVAFGASAAGSWVLQAKMQTPSTEEDATSSPPATTSDGTPSSEATAAGKGPSGDLPVAVRPQPMSVEEVLRFGMGIRKREEHLRERSEALDREQSRMQLALADIRGEQQHIEGLQAKLEGQAETCQSLLAEIQQARQKLATDRESAKQELNQFKDVLDESSDQEIQNIKQMSEWMQSMEPEKAAQALDKMVNDGQMDLAIKLLSNFEDRDAAKILSALPDYALMVELAERFRNYKRPPRKEANRR